jgi:molybdate-binding protein
MQQNVNLLDAVVDNGSSQHVDAYVCAMHSVRLLYAKFGDMRHFRLAAVLKVQYSHSYTNYITYCTGTCVIYGMFRASRMTFLSDTRTSKIRFYL